MPGAGAGSEVWNRDLAIQPGERLRILAQSGKGKTTLLSVLYGLRKDYRGRVHFDGADIRRYGRDEWQRLRQSRLAFVFQDLQLFDELTARQNVDLKNRLTTHKSASEIQALFEALGLADKQDAPAGQLSRGQQQRVAIIRALCQPFEFLLLDEPFSHLDQTMLGQAAAVLDEECRLRGAGLILTSLEPESSLDCHVVKKL